MFPDALVGGAAIGVRGGILLPTPQASLSAAAHDVLAKFAPYKPSVEVLGGPNSVALIVEEEARQLAGLS